MVNISDVILTDTQIDLLSKGLSFCPSHRVDWFQLELEFFFFIRNLKLKVWFDVCNIQSRSTEDGQVTCEDESKMCFSLKQYKLRKDSDFIPPMVSHPIQTFHDLVKKDLDQLQKMTEGSKLNHPNMTRAELAAMKELADNTLITIKPADKGGAVVVWGTKDYLAEVRRQ